jgi:uncharacterized protein DUF4157/putative peptidoglycan binding protein
MPEIAQQQRQTRSSQLVHPARLSRTNHRPADVENPLLARQQALGNQAVQRLLHVGLIQAKLTINEPGDQYEQEADRVAEQVMRMPAPQTSKGAVVSGQVQPPRIQRLCPNCEEELHRQTQELHFQRMCQECEEEEAILQKKTVPGRMPEASPAVQSQVNALPGSGQPLPESVRASFEPRFGCDFSQVRIHTGARATESARAVSARAYTVGQDVVFGAGQYAPGTAAGQRLLAHELTHVVQQSKEPGSRLFLQRAIVERQPGESFEDCLDRNFASQGILNTVVAAASVICDFLPFGTPPWAVCVGATAGVEAATILRVLAGCFSPTVTATKAPRPTGAVSPVPGPAPPVQVPPVPVTGTLGGGRAPTCAPQGNRGPFPHPLVRQGSVGTAVGELQEKLNITGASPALTVDCQFGPKTKAAVVQFQVGRGLVPDGVVGPNTWAALDAAAPTVITLPPVVITGSL